MAMHDTKFRVIIIGAGPTGLYMAKALVAANIDFIVLEKGPSTFLDRGNHYLIFPHTCRLLHQVGLYDEAKNRSYELTAKCDLMSNGAVLSHYLVWSQLKQVHGYPTLPLQRCDLLDILYQSIPNRDQVVKTEAKIVKVEEAENGVKVYLADGTVESGSVVVGADGTYGIVKKYIHEARSESMSLASAPVVGTPTSSHFYSIFARGSNKHNIPSGIFFETRDTGRGVQLGANGDMINVVMYKKLPQPSTTQIIYSEEDMEKFAESLFDLVVTPGGVTVGDIWPDIHKQTARLVSQEEGFSQHWHTNRVVITGDAAVTISSVNALGVNCGLHSTAVLASQLQEVVSSAVGSPTAEALGAAFDRYQRIRTGELTAISKFAYATVRQLTWDSWTDWFMDRFLKRWIGPDTLVKRYFHPMIAKGQVLRYVPFQSEPGLMPWRWNPDCAKKM
ncbi:hypothetical protein B0I35DRAFT_447286 [Stachybotrys elegans]|uniref:FAD-binding domain-containing protein n=1 Tax=Stachybotrys elegans TaxID=80388 RepID=A0A8K0SB09_9HYPO|nr:hypothetical protein B0I35DRAFT_447286 [Stachybotrys elegans]